MSAASRTAVALLFDDAALGVQLRDALGEHGARIVYEGPLAGFDSAQLAAAQSDVVVASLDDDTDDAVLDRLDGLAGEGRLRVVFDDAQASRGLSGWDLARWARHLAAKALAGGDVDPPRPADAREVEPVPVAAPRDAPVDAAAVSTDTTHDEPLSMAVAGPAATLPEAADEAGPQRTEAESETLAAELEALLAADGHDEGGASGDGREPASGGGDEGGFAGPGMDLEPTPDGAGDSMAIVALAEAAGPPDFSSLALDEPRTGVAPEPAPARGAPPKAPDWALLDDDAPAQSPARHAPADFGIEKISAADFLAPEADAGGESPITPGLSLELVSIEEAIAPQPHQEAVEMVLDDLGGVPSRWVLLGATTEGTASVCEFLAGLPEGLAAAILHTQHLAGRSVDELVEHLAAHCALPVRLAQAGARARRGEVRVVPPGQQLRLLRDGSIVLQAADEVAAHAPSIDASFTMAANVFGRDALAIVFAGSSTDAVGGCQAIHDRGGRVWAEASAGEHVADMVGAVMAERLAQFTGTPRELAARLAEEFQGERRP